MTIEDRLAKLERSNRHLRFSLIAVVALAAAGFIAGAAMMPAIGPNIRTRKIEIVDAGGRVRSVWTCVNGHPVLSFADAQARPRAALQLGEPTALRFWDAQGRPRAAIGMSQGYPVMALQGVGPGNVGMGVDSDGGFIQVVDWLGNYQFEAP